MKKSLIIILALALLCTGLCACGNDDRGSGSVSDNDNGVITDENNGSDIIDKADDAMPSATPNTKNTDKPLATAIPGDNNGNGNGGSGNNNSADGGNANIQGSVNPTQPVTP